MKTTKEFVMVIIAATVMASSISGVFAQTPDAAVNKTRQRLATKNVGQAKTSKENTESKLNLKQGEADPSDGAIDPGESGDVVQTASAVKAPSLSPAVPEGSQTNRHEQASEEAAIVPYYNNFFNTYRLGPEDVISVSVFGQDRYSRAGIIVPPSGRISLALIPGGVFVNGKTVDEVAELIKKSYDEYIIEPQVSVSLDKASSYRYSVIGDVAQPGIRLMNRRLTVTEALGEAGGVLQTGDRSKVVVLRRQADGNLTPIAVNVSAIYKGRAPDLTYLVPGDQVIVPGNKFKTFQKVMTLFPILHFARIFTGGVF